MSTVVMFLAPTGFFEYRYPKVVLFLHRDRRWIRIFDSFETYETGLVIRVNANFYHSVGFEDAASVSERRNVRYILIIEIPSFALSIRRAN